tara:strand:+ start:254 stop:493 length:240 start_codon:yes stop_codon:yes gene_type:complete
MSILLAIIALNLFSIAGSQRTVAEASRRKLICLEYFSTNYLQVKEGDKVSNEFKRRLNINNTDAFLNPYCLRLLKMNVD